ncbi:MAG TPA: pilin assembly protein [Steroidobacteraceae bacterium]|nr:pilin assembly protein [Steroidobacteraceae bacterium]
MSFKELLDSWRTTAAAPRTARSFSVRLPVESAAQLAALAELFPGRAPEQLVTELLGAALTEIAAAMPYVVGKRVISTDEQGDPVYEDVGLMPRFMQLTRAHRARLEGRGRRAAAPQAVATRRRRKTHR